MQMIWIIYLIKPWGRFMFFFFFSSRRRHTRFDCDWSSDVCSSDLLIRRHLSDIAERFARGDFSGPTEIHGGQMPGLADLKKARPGEISVHYQDLVNGGQIEYSTRTGERRVGEEGRSRWAPDNLKKK